MEIQGVPTGSTSGNSSTNSDSTVFAAMASTLKNIEKNTFDGKNLANDTLKYLKSMVNLLKPTANVTSIASNQPLISSLDNNTLAIRSLTDLISNKQFTLDIKGNSVSYFSRMLNMMTDEKAIAGIDKFSKVFETAVKGIAMLDNYSQRINNLSSSLTGAMGSFNQIGKGFLMIAGGLALLGVTIATFISAITPADLLMFGGIILALRFAGTLSEGANWDFAKLAVSIAMLGISIWAFTELVDFDMTVSFAGSLLAITGAMWAMSRIAAPVAAQSKNMLLASGAVAIMAGSMWVFGKILTLLPQIDAANALATGIAIAGFATVYGTIGTTIPLPVMASAAAGVAMMGGSMWLMAKGLNDMNQVQMSFGRGMEIAAMMVGAAGVFALIGNPFTAPFIGIGIALTAGIAAGLWLLTKGLNNISNIKISAAQAGEFKNSLVNVIMAMASLGNPLYAIPIAVSTPIALALAGSTLGVVAAMMAVSKMPALEPKHFLHFKVGLGHLIDAFGAFSLRQAPRILASVPVAVALAASSWLMLKAMDSVSQAKMLTKEQTDNFKSSISGILDAFSSIGVKSRLKAVASVPIMTAITISALFIKKAISVVNSSQTLEDKKIADFRKAVTGLVSIYDDVGFFKIGKLAYVSGMMSTIGITTMMTSKLLKNFQATELDITRIDTNLNAFSSFFNGITKVFTSNSGKFSEIQKGIAAYSGITKLTKGLAKTIKSFANLTFEEFEMVNGVVVSKGKTTLSQNDLRQVAVSIGSVLNALTEPLANIGGSKNSYSIGGFEVTNPFSNKVKDGIKAMSKVGSMLKPLTNAVLLFSSNNVDVRAVKVFNWSVAAILSTIAVSFTNASKNLKDVELSNLKSSISMVEQLNNAVIKPGFIEGVGYFRIYSKEVANVKTSINEINSEKLKNLTMMLGHLSELNKTQGLKALIDSFKEFIEVFMTYTDDRKAEIAANEAAMSAQTEAYSNAPSANPLIPNNRNGFIEAIPQQAPAPVQTAGVDNSAQLNKIYNELSNIYKAMFVDGKTIKAFITPYEIK